MAACILVGIGYQVQAQPAAPYYDVVALRVEFQPDTTRFTTGDGTFDGLRWPLESRVDPLPHDAAYFEAHLDFLRDYVEAASGGRTRVKTHLIDSVVQVSRTMDVYSPRGMEADSDAERVRLARLVEEAWRLADQSVNFDVSGLDPDGTAFVIFHAGIGRDVELTGTALTKTPLDLPSLFFSEAALASLGVSQLTFKGLPVTQTAIIPRSETRAGINAITDAPILLELSINGLLAASFFNYLGIPDLFNTQTGESGIGPFGLMDPLGFFAFRGLFPPMPTAWTRVALGWVKPKELESGEAFSLAAGEVARASISESEYFLVENRVRDAEGTGVTLQVWNQDQSSDASFGELSDGFNQFNVEDFPGGVVTAASNYDWALPGWDADGNQFNGGILIWHIDEQQLSQGVNDDPDRRAVDLEEADGAQDIGYDSNAGSPFDFYFAGNPVQVVLPSGRGIALYKNRFAHDTTPSSATSDGGESFVILEAFSEPGAVMTGRFSYGSGSRLELTGGFDLNSTTSAGSAIQAVGPVVSVYTGQAVLFEDSTIAPIGAQARPIIEGQRMAVIDTTQEGYVYQIYEHESHRLALVSRLEFEALMPIKGGIVGASDAHYVLLTEGRESRIIRLTSEAEEIVLNEAGLGLVADPASGVYFVGQTATGRLGEPADWTYTIDVEAQTGLPVMGRDHTGVWGAIPLQDGILVLRSDHTTSRIYSEMHTGASVPVDHVALADLDDDNVLDIVAVAGEQVLAWSQNGALLYPFPLELGAPAAAEPLIGRNSTGATVVVAGRDGTVYGFDLRMGGVQSEGFPIAVGRSIVAVPLLEEGQLHVVTQSGRLRRYGVPDLQAVAWGQYRGSAQNAGWIALDAPAEPDRPLLVAEETYNWPNPVRYGHTFFRCQTTEAAEVTITIIDAAGTLIEEFTHAVAPHSPTEFSWQAEVSSGLYFARVMAVGVSGGRDSQLIKFAVIR